ncbi:MAG: CHAT domain-containing protein, partial [Anaerolineae bacterium]|nr:CHAT domain-containing protein [Anaerolineae bacterium]
SEEPWIPWELCRLQGEEHGWIVEGEFLCEAFNITRWFVNPNLQQRPTLTLNKIGLVVPESSYLPHAPDERAYLLSLKNRDVQEIPARFLDVRRALASGQYDGWHFTGHGSFRGTTPNRSEMILDQQETLRPEDLNGKIKNLGRAHPLVFLNACEIGQGGMSLTDVGGWSARFIKAGAAAFIGAYWSIIDEQALEFAKAFYTGLLEHRLPIGEAVRQARLAIKKPGEPTRLAYTVFADPLATVQ